MTKTEDAHQCTVTELRESVMRRYEDVDEFTYWEEAAGPQYATEAMAVAKAFLQDEAHLERILVARKHDETLSTDLFFEQVRFRARYRPQEIDPKTIPNALPSGAWRLCGYSRDGHVISNYKLHFWDVSAYDENLDEAVEEYVRYVLYMIELMIGSMKDDSQQFVVLFDLSGFYYSLVLKTSVRMMIRKMIYVAQAQYPERLHQALLVNAPYGFETAWSMIRPLLDEKTAGKVHFCSQEELSEHIDHDVLSVEYGGTHAEYPVPSKSIKQEIESSSEDSDKPVNES